MSQPSLQEVQRWLKSKILPAGPIAPPDAAVELNPQGNAPGAERLSVYADGYLARVEEALCEVYETVRHVLGRRAFLELTESYAKRYPSHDYNLSLVGRHLPQHLAAWPLTHELPFLPDLARLEWLVAQAVHAFEQPPLEVSQLAAWSPEDWERARVLFQPSVGCIASAWPILDMWESRGRPIAEIQIDLVDRPQRVLVARQGVRIRCELLDQRQYDLLRGLLEGQSLGAVCEAIARDMVDSPPLTEWFAHWVQGGLIVRCA